MKPFELVASLAADKVFPVLLVLISILYLFIIEGVGGQDIRTGHFILHCDMDKRMSAGTPFHTSSEGSALSCATECLVKNK